MEDDEELFLLTGRQPHRKQQQQQGWRPRDLSVPSFEYATKTNQDTATNMKDPSAIVPQSRRGVQLHLEQQFSTTTAADSSFSSRHDDKDDHHHHHHGKKSRYKKTGTTIAGCVCSDGHVILAADTRATQNTIVADKRAQKLHPLSRNAWCAGAGTSADLEMITKQCLYSMALEQLRDSTIGNDNDGMHQNHHLMAMYTTSAKQDEEDNGNSLLVGKVSVGHLCSFLQEKLWKEQGNLGVNLILGCVDQDGRAYLRALHPHGSMDVDLPFAALGSGGLAAMSILERGYHRRLNVTEATELVQAAIVAGIQNDLGSGSQVDLCVIRPDGSSQMTRCVVPSQVLEDIEAPPKAATPPLPAEDSAGVNGFGNSPFRIKSQRVLMNTVQHATKEAEWATLLGHK
jgi:20S proteasome subunit beta 2